MNLVKTYINRSSIQGIGLFAEEFIPKGTLIWEFHDGFDMKIKQDDFDFIMSEKSTMSKSMKLFLDTYTNLKNGFYWHYGDNAKYCNHSKNPNTHGFPEQYASTDINIGDEITCDYSKIDDNFNNEY